ncbi:hypothetical protein B5X24_HaOG216102, partial [Helicoverpa armigera]
DLASSSWRLSPSSSGYKTLSLRSTDSITPSPTGGASPEPACSTASSIPAGVPDTGVVWCVTDMAAVPAGALLIHPMTGRPLTNPDGTVYTFDPANPPVLYDPAAVQNDEQQQQLDPNIEKRRGRLEKQHSFIDNECECQPSEECRNKCCCECRRHDGCHLKNNNNDKPNDTGFRIGEYHLASHFPTHVPVLPTEEHKLTPSPQPNDTGFRIDPSYPYAAVDYTAAACGACVDTNTLQHQQRSYSVPYGPVEVPQPVLPPYAIPNVMMPQPHLQPYPQYQEQVPWGMPTHGVSHKLMLPDLYPIVQYPQPSYQHYNIVYPQPERFDARNRVNVPVYRQPYLFRQVSPGTWCRRSPGPVHPVLNNPRRPHPDNRNQRR